MARNLEEILITVELTGAGQRLDTFLCEKLEGKSRSQIRKMVKNGEITIKGKWIKCGRLLKASEVISIKEEPVPEYAIVPQDIPLDILFEDDDLLIVNKPAGLTVHPAPGNPDGTLVNALLHHTSQLAETDRPERPGIVHRLDKNTSGVLLVAKNSASHAALSGQFMNREVKKVYLAMIYGRLRNKKDCIRHFIGRSKGAREKMTVKLKGGKLGITRYEILKEAPGFSLVKVLPTTGRTHQIRVHFSHLHHPIVGDPVYGGEIWRGLQNPIQRKAVKSFDRLALHAHVLAFSHPSTKEPLTFKAPAPEAFLALQQKLGL